MLPMFGGLIFVAFIVIALAVELSLLGSAYRDAAAVADAASETGAAMLAPDAVYDSRIELDPPSAENASRSAVVAVARPGAIADVAASTTQVCVTIRDQYFPRTLVFIGFNEIDIVVTSCAEPRTG